MNEENKSTSARWVWYAVGEGLSRTASRILSKFIGVAGGSLGNSIFATMAIGVVQALGGLLIALIRRENLFPGLTTISLSIFFGSTAFLMTVLGIFVFTYEDADVGVVSFFVTASIITDALLGRMLFKERLRKRQIIGIVLFVVSGYAILNFPALAEMLHVPIWVLLSLLIAFLASANEGLMSILGRRKVTDGARQAGPFSNNFWIGATTVFLSALLITAMNLWDYGELLTARFWYASLGAGLAVILLVSFKFLAFKKGGALALKKFFMMGTHLATAMLFGVLVYGEQFTAGKMIGLVGFLASFALMDESTFYRLKSAVFHRNPRD